MPTRLAALALILLALTAGAAARAAEGGTAALLDISGAIGPATSGYLEKAHRQALDSGAALIILRIDTPGGLDTAMRDIVKQILNSPVPYACLVAPGGARAASAGTYILYACHVAAMAPATNLGAATPVPVGAGFPGGDDKEKPAGKDAAKDQDPGAKPDDAAEPAAPSGPGDSMERKVINDAVAYIRGLAKKRGRNADWAERAVREGVSLPADAALEQGVVDLVADDVPALLAAIDGRKVTTSTGEQVLKTAGLAVQTIEPDWRMQFLAVITNPTVAYLLLLVGIYGLLLEGYSPGAILPGVLGAICLLLALFAFQVLPVNYVGLALILLGVVLMVAEALVPSFGVLGFGGIAAFVFGSILLMDIDVPGYGVNRGVIFGIAASGAGLMGLTLYMLWRSRQAVVVTGDGTLVGHTVEVEEDLEQEGWGLIFGERWRVRSPRPLKRGDRPKVVAVDGLVLVVEP